MSWREIATLREEIERFAAHIYRENARCNQDKIVTLIRSKGAIEFTAQVLEPFTKHDAAVQEIISSLSKRVCPKTVHKALKLSKISLDHRLETRIGQLTNVNLVELVTQLHKCNTIIGFIKTRSYHEGVARAVELFKGLRSFEKSVFYKQFLVGTNQVCLFAFTDHLVRNNYVEPTNKMDEVVKNLPSVSTSEPNFVRASKTSKIYADYAQIRLVEAAMPDVARLLDDSEYSPPFELIFMVANDLRTVNIMLTSDEASAFKPNDEQISTRMFSKARVDLLKSLFFLIDFPMVKRVLEDSLFRSYLQLSDIIYERLEGVASKEFHSRIVYNNICAKISEVFPEASDANSTFQLVFKLCMIHIMDRIRKRSVEESNLTDSELVDMIMSYSQPGKRSRLSVRVPTKCTFVEWEKLLSSNAEPEPLDEFCSSVRSKEMVVEHALREARTDRVKWDSDDYFEKMEMEIQYQDPQEIDASIKVLETGVAELKQIGDISIFFKSVPWSHNGALSEIYNRLRNLHSIAVDKMKPVMKQKHRQSMLDSEVLSIVFEGEPIY